MGKAILAHLPDYRITQIIENHVLISHTLLTIMDESELVAELEVVREYGLALNDQKHIQGLRGVGTPIRYDGERVLGAVSLSGSASNWSGD